jgi:hypothetical protein
MKYLITLSILSLLLSYSYSNNKIVYLEPVPGANLVSTENNIIIGFDKPINVNEEDIKNSIIITGSTTKLHNGTVIICSDNKKILFKPTIPFAPDEAINVKLTGDLLKSISSGRKGFSYSFTTSPKKLPWDPIKSFKDEYQIGQNSSNNNDSPPPLPQLTVSIYNNPMRGDVFLSNFSFNIYPPYLIIADNRGSMYWYMQRNFNCDDFKLQPNGHITFYDLGVYEHIEMDENYNTVNTYSCGNGYVTDGHELRLMSNGHAYVMAYDLEIVDMSKIVPGGNPHANVMGLIVQEIDVNKNVVFQWRSWDHFKITDAWHQKMDSSDIDAVHGNAIEIDNDSNIIISSRHLDEITKINHITGDIIWRFGGKNNQFTFIGDTLKFTYQHAIRRIANGDLTLFDNGNWHSPPFSRAVEYSLDEVNKTATVVWEYRHNPDIYGFAMGYVQRLSNGNTLIGWGTGNPSITEVKPDGTIVFEMSLPQGGVSYRAYKFDWHGPSGNLILSSFMLNQNFPNPFNSSTTISFIVPDKGSVKIVIYDLLGNEVRTVLNDVKEAGKYSVTVDASTLSSGVYFYRMVSGDFSETRKMVLIK